MTLDGKVIGHHLLQRARYRCEYCSRRIEEVQYEIDHIIPGAGDDPANLAVACGRCNRNKGANTTARDRLLCTTVALYNPRTMAWGEHFRSMGPELVGLTPVGRATAALIWRGTPQFVPPDLQWHMLEGLSHNEGFYSRLNHLRYLRLQNEFQRLEGSLREDFDASDGTPGDVALARRVREYIRVEAIYTESRPSELWRGVGLARSLLASDDHADHRDFLLSASSVLHQQLATIAVISGSLEGARRLQNRSLALHVEAMRAVPARRDDIALTTDRLRAVALAVKHDTTAFPDSRIRYARDLVVGHAVEHMRALLYLVDVVLTRRPVLWRELEALYIAATTLLETRGYGSTIDKAQLVIVRRRWWILHFLLDSPPRFDRFADDMQFWRAIKMWNEVRELTSGLARVRDILPPGVAEKAQALLRT